MNAARIAKAIYYFDDPHRARFVVYRRACGLERRTSVRYGGDFLTYAQALRRARALAAKLKVWPGPAARPFFVSMKLHVGTTTRHQERRCPRCGHKLDASCAFDTAPIDTDRGPQPGDYVLCGGCTALLRYDERLTFRSLTGAELCALKASPMWAVIEHGRAAWLATGPRKPRV